MSATVHGYKMGSQPLRQARRQSVGNNGVISGRDDDTMQYGLPDAGQIACGGEEFVKLRQTRQRFRKSRYQYYASNIEVRPGFLKIPQKTS